MEVKNIKKKFFYSESIISETVRYNFFGIKIWREAIRAYEISVGDFVRTRDTTATSPQIEYIYICTFERKSASAPPVIIISPRDRAGLCGTYPNARQHVCPTAHQWPENEFTCDVTILLFRSHMHAHTCARELSPPFPFWSTRWPVACETQKGCVKSRRVSFLATYHFCFLS